MKQFTPLNDLEIALSKTKSGQSSVPEFLQILVDSDLIVSSASEVMPDGSGFQPILFPKDGVSMLACFTDMTRIGEYATLAPYSLVMKGRDILKRMPPDYGLVVNPGNAIGFDVAPEGIRKIVRDFQ